MQKLPTRIRIDPQITIVVASGGALALLAGAFVPEDYAIGCLILGVCGLIGAAYMTTLDVAVFTKTAVIISGVQYPFAQIETVETAEREVTVPRRNGRSYQAIQSSLILYPPGDGKRQLVDIKNARHGAESVAETLRAHLEAYRARQANEG